MSDEAPDPVPTVAALGLKDDAPRAVVKAIVTAAQAAGPTNPVAVEKALTTFNRKEHLPTIRVVVGMPYQCLFSRVSVAVGMSLLG